VPNGVEAANTPSQDEGSHVLLGLLIVLAKHKMLVLGLPLAAGIVALIVALLLPNIYTATARILPPQQRESSAAAMVGLLTGAAGGAAANVGQAFGIRNPNDLYVGILKGTRSPIV
jgi:tyrosine-protein kinase Etk/Wzc